jgi:signal transduction histidine kinase
MNTAVAVVAIVVLALVLVWREAWSRRAFSQLQQQLDVAQARLKEREELASIGQMVSGLAQELKSPLQGVIGNTELMLAESTRTAEGNVELREIQENAARAAGIVRNLLSFTQPSGALDRRWHDVNDIVARALHDCRPELEASGVRVRLEKADRLPLVYVDGRQLEKVVATLLAKPAASRRPTTTREKPDVTLSTSRTGGGSEDHLVIELNDRAAAMPNEESWSNDVAACRRVVEAHGGSLRVDANQGFGVHCYLELPVTAAVADAAAH